MSKIPHGVVPGSLKEREVIQDIASIIKEHVDHIEILDIPVYTWEWSCVVKIDSDTRDCVLLPYSPSVYLELDSQDIIYKDLKDIIKSNVTGKIVITDYPERPWELRIITYLISRKNPSVILLVNRSHVGLKSDLVLGTPGFTYQPSIPPIQPVISIEPGTFDLILTRRAQLYANSKLMRAKGRILVAWLNGKGEKEIHITAHHDSIIGDFEKTPAKTLVAIVKSLAKESLPVNIKAIFLTSREIGDVDFTEYHYMWGERYLLEVLDAKGELDNVLISLSIGPLTGSADLKAVINPVFSDFTERHGLPTTYDMIYNEAGPYTEKGILSMSFTLSDSHTYRNSTYGDVRSEVEKRLVEIIQHLVKTMNIKSVESNMLKQLRNHILSKIGEQELELRAEVTRLLDLAEIQIEFNTLRSIMRIAHSLIEIACTNPLRILVREAPLENLSKDFISEFRRVLTTCEEEVLLGDKLRYDFVRVNGSFINTYVDLRMKTYVKYLRNVIDSEINKAICLKHLKRCVQRGEESDRNR